MKKILIIILIIIAAIAYWGSYPVEKERKMIKEIVVNYDSTDTPYMRHGIYREVYRKFNYAYHDSTYDIGERLYDEHERDYYVNEYGDTVLIVYTDFTNYPRREE